MTKSNNKFYNPIKLILIYLIGTELLYFFGPLDWQTKNITILLLFFIISNLLLYLGYRSTMAKLINKGINDKKQYIPFVFSERTVLKYLRFLIPFNLVMSVANLLRYSGLNVFSITQIFENLLLGFNNAGAQYSAKFENASLFGGDILAPLSTALAPILWPVLPLSLFYFKKLTKINRILIIFTVFFEVTRWISIGTNKGIVDIFLILLSIYILQKNSKAIQKRRSYNNLILFFVVTIFLSLGLYFFSNTISSRIGDSMLIVQSLANNTQIDTDSLILKIFPDYLKITLIYITLYLTQGYQGLSLTFNEPFVPMFGIGNSNFLIENIQEVFNTNIFRNTYQYRIQHSGWDAQVNWHSIYSWLANDLSYIGVIILMFFIGKYIAIIYFRSIKYKDPLFIVLFSLIVIMIFYFPINNQIAAMPNTFMAFWFLNILWLLGKVKKTLKKSV